ncbi:phenylalanine ammonia-lyase [Fusarium sp. NRRL 52700]|nr:phenylalanine ammonia-lyase [Fusarium sp. NRRL 52700]
MATTLEELSYGIVYKCISSPSALSPHLLVVQDIWSRLQERKKNPAFEFDGKSLHVADVVAVAYHDSMPELSSNKEVREQLDQSVEVLKAHLQKGHYVYGVNTGFGGSADTRTEDVIKLQAALMQLTQAGIIPKDSKGPIYEHCMPPSWVRATMIVRCNATARGHSAVSTNILQGIINLIQNRLNPVVPLRGSVSASGDLMPLSYIAGAIEGNPDVLVQTVNGHTLPAPQALREAGLLPVTLGPKEGLGIVNGTASSAALGALVMEKSHFLALFTQAMTSMAVEALHGSVESFLPFIAQVRPHPGQIECAQNISLFLQETHLAQGVHSPQDRRPGDLIQDRYSLRSATQWIGPQLEDLLLAHHQVTTELNSSCDNPLVNTATGDILYGCNFQAASITSAMEKTRLSLQMFGRVLFAQVAEMIDPSLSGGLPANLAADDPSLSFALKGVDISMASYMAELSYFANPLSSHVQAAEMHNQSINSMALASGRMTMEAIEILQMMCACALYSGCQALDLRVLHTTYVKNATAALLDITRETFCTGLDPEAIERVQEKLIPHLAASWNASGRKDLQERCQDMVTTALPIFVQHVAKEDLPHIEEWKLKAADKTYEVWEETFGMFCDSTPTAGSLGIGSRALYQFVREDLGVPFHRGLADHPKIKDAELGGKEKKTIGGWISSIYDAIASGALTSRKMGNPQPSFPHLIFLDVGMKAPPPSNHSGSIIKIKGDGTSICYLATGEDWPDGIDADPSSDRMFWTCMGVPDSNNGRVKSAKLDGSDMITIVPQGVINTPKQICFEPASEMLYVADREGMRILRFNREGSSLEVLVQNGNWRVDGTRDATKWCVRLVYGTHLLCWHRNSGT